MNYPNMYHILCPVFLFETIIWLSELSNIASLMLVSLQQEIPFKTLERGLWLWSKHTKEKDRLGHCTDYFHSVMNKLDIILLFVGFN